MKQITLLVRNSSWITQVAILAAVVLMTACVTLTPIVPEKEASQIWQSRSDYLFQQHHWIAHLSMIGVTDDQKFKTRAEWHQKGDRYTIKLRDFIGRTIAIIDGSPDGVTAKTSKGQKFEGENAEQLIQELFDIQIPVTGMRYWLLALPEPSFEVEQLTLNDQGLTGSLDQQGWMMSYPYYMQYSPYQMPSQVLLDYDDINLTVKVSKWEFNTE